MFTKGKSGNPSGRPKGIKDRRNRYVDSIEEQTPEMIGKMIEMGLGGDVMALKYCLDKVIPNCRRERIELEQGFQADTVKDLMRIGTEAIEKVSKGEITPEDGKEVFAMLESQRKMHQTIELEDLLEKIQEERKRGK